MRATARTVLADLGDNGLLIFQFSELLTLRIGMVELWYIWVFIGCKAGSGHRQQPPARF